MIAKKKARPKTKARRRSTATRSHSYDVVDAVNRRKQTSSVLKSEDDHLGASSRKQLTAETRHAHRNFAIAGWAIRKHLDFVSSFSFSCKSSDREFKRAVERYIASRERKYHFDIAGRHPRRRFIRLLEARRTVDGDIAALKLASGHLQAIEGDRIRDPAKMDRGEDWKHGVKTNAAGRALAYAIHKRTTGGGFEHERTVAAWKVLHHAHFDRFDQRRGITPLAAGVASLLDTYETIDYTVAKAKISQLFGLVVTRDSENPMAPTASTGESETSTKYEVDFGKGPVYLDMDHGDDAKFLENKTPPAELDAFLHHLIAIALKSLDIPYSFYDEAHTNFFGSRSALILYLKSAQEKRADVRDLLTDWAEWQLARGIASGELDPPPEDGEILFDWTAAGIPWWNPTQEVKANADAVANCFTSRRRVVKETLGEDFEDIVEENREDNQLLADAGLLEMVPAAAKVAKPPAAAQS